MIVTISVCLVGPFIDNHYKPLILMPNTRNCNLKTAFLQKKEDFKNSLVI